MQTFVTTVDGTEHTWRLRVVTSAIERVKADTGIDLLDIEDGRAIQQVAEEANVYRVLWSLCREQAQEAGVDQDAFEESLHGEPLDAAVNAFMEAYTDFFRGPRRTALKGILTKTQEYENAVDKAVKEKLKSLDVTAAAEASLSGGESTSSPESSE